MQMPALTIAKQQGWITIAADGKKDAPGNKLCEQPLMPPIKLDCDKS
jgi:hypothetical protein